MRQRALRDFIFLAPRASASVRGAGFDLAEVYLEPKRGETQMLERRLDFVASQIELKLFRRGDLQFVVDQRDFDCAIASAENCRPVSVMAPCSFARQSSSAKADRGTGRGGAAAS